MQVVAEIQYEKRHQIGVGQGMNSEVFLAFDPQLGGEIAVKEIAKSKLGNNPSAYFAEAQVMFESAHPNVVPIHCACATADRICLAMPFFRRGSLADRIKDVPLPLQEALRVAHGVLSGLARIHRAGFLHFDLKPSNVFFSETNTPMVADFGQSRRLGPGGTVQVPEMYRFVIPPETWAHQVGLVESDVYQCGLLLYRIINGDPLFGDQRNNVGSTQELRFRVLSGKFPDRHRFLPHVPKRIRTLIRKALRVDPADRFHSALEFSDDLARLKVDLDWHMSRHADGSVFWRAHRQEATDLVVGCVRAGAAWSARVWTENSGTRRMKRNFSGDGLSFADAQDHLKTVFSDLG
jgi:serine/threonine protein kinase